MAEEKRVGLEAGPMVPRYAGIPEVARWVSRSGVWLHHVRIGRIATREPFPTPDGVLRQKDREVPLWRTDRESEIRSWMARHLNTMPAPFSAARNAKADRNGGRR